MTAIWAVALLSVALVLSSSFESVLVFSGFILALNTFCGWRHFCFASSAKAGWNATRWLPNLGVSPDATALSCANGLDPGVHFYRASRRSARAVLMIAAGLGLYWFSERKGGQLALSFPTPNGGQFDKVARRRSDRASMASWISSFESERHSRWPHSPVHPVWCGLLRS